MSYQTQRTLHRYVNPKHCVHREVTIADIGDQLMAYCDVCGLEGPPVKLGIKWLTRIRATSSFYWLANKIDKEL